MFERLNRHPLPVVFFTVFIDLLGFGILIPIIPLLLANPHSVFFLLPSNLTIKQGYIILGFLVAIFPFMQFLATPILGQLSDRYGRKKLLAFSLAGTSLSYVIFAIGIITKNLPLLFIARAFDGITGGNIAVAQAAIADITDPAHRAKNFGMIGAAFGLGFIVGPYLGGKLSDPSIVSWFSASTPFWFAAALAALNTLSVLTVFPETLKNLKHDMKIQWGKSIHNIVEAYSMPRLRVLFITVFLFFGGFTFFTTFFSVFLINKFSFSQSNIGDFFSYVGIWMALAQIVLVRKLAKVFAEYQVLRISLVGVSLFLLCFFLPNAWWQLLLVVPFFAACIGLTTANSIALVSKSADATIQGEVLGINASVQALAQAIPAALSGFIAAGLKPEAPIFVASAIVYFAWLFFVIFYKPGHVAHQEVPAAV